MSIQELLSKLKFSDFISVLALIISGTSILWNIYRDLLLKASMKVNVQISKIVQPGKDLGTFIVITATNHGPGSIICESIWIRKKSLWLWVKRISKYAFVIHDYTNPLSSKLPKKLEVGEKLQLLFPYKEKMFLANKPSDVGIMDSFGRIHWAEKNGLIKAIDKYLKEYPEQKWEEN